MLDRQHQNAEEASVDQPVEPPAPVRSSGVLAFVLEVALLCSAALWAIQVLPWAPVPSVIVVLVPLLVFWGFFLAPQAKRRFGWPVLPLVSHVLFLMGVAALFASAHPWFGGIMLVLTLASVATTWFKRGQIAADTARLPHGRRRPAGRRAAR